MPETSLIHFIPYPADTLYVLAKNQDLIVAQLIDLGKKWRADSVDVCDGSNEMKTGNFETMYQFAYEEPSGARILSVIVMQSLFPIGGTEAQ